MTPLRHIVEPTGLWLTWQPADITAPTRVRRVVGLLYRGADGVPVFQYLQGTADFEAAKDAGFRGFPAFDPRSLKPVLVSALEPFLRRLPPRKREDFAEYLAQHRLPSPFPASDIALLGYTGALLPGDSFELVPIFSEDAVPLDYITELAGVRYVFAGSVEALSPGDPILFHQDFGNPVDEDAVIGTWQGQRLGFVNRALRKSFLSWLQTKAIRTTIERINGLPQRPRVYVRIEVRADRTA